MRRAAIGFSRNARAIAQLLLRPFGYLAFTVAVWALAICARLLGREHDLGGFAGRLALAFGRHPELTRQGLRVAWTLWGFALVLACSPLDPLATWWDEVVLVAIAAGMLWQRLFTGPPGSV
ncbi:MAG TPA: hypothetical protein VN672_10795 [Solirubrobacteraceae bacterium]|nr:hypothetical protein [Solirubrobacteraceae bacterium]